MMTEEEDEKIIDDPQWFPIGNGPNLISGRQSGKGNATFADRHVEPVTPGFGSNLVNSNPTL